MELRWKILNQRKFFVSFFNNLIKIIDSIECYLFPAFHIQIINPVGKTAVVVIAEFFIDSSLTRWRCTPFISFSHAVISASWTLMNHDLIRSGNYRMAKGYKWSTSPSGQRRVYKKFRDNYNCRLPNWVYELYMKRRKQITFDAIYNLDKIVKKRDEKLSLI